MPPKHTRARSCQKKHISFSCVVLGKPARLSPTMVHVTLATARATDTKAALLVGILGKTAFSESGTMRVNMHLQHFSS